LVVFLQLRESLLEFDAHPDISLGSITAWLTQQSYINLELVKKR
jgi:hypothetical protein